jgi:hypothetical protein
MNLGELIEALLRIREQSGLSPQTGVIVRMHPDQILNVTDSLAAIRSIELVDDGTHLAVMISNAVVR